MHSITCSYSLANKYSIWKTRGLPACYGGSGEDPGWGGALWASRLLCRIGHRGDPGCVHQQVACIFVVNHQVGAGGAESDESLANRATDEPVDGHCTDGHGTAALAAYRRLYLGLRRQFDDIGHAAKRRCHERTCCARLAGKVGGENILASYKGTVDGAHDTPSRDLSLCGCIKTT